MPKRVQRKRTKGWRMPENTVYVGRGSKWCNPHKVAECQKEMKAYYTKVSVRRFKKDLLAGILAFTVKDMKSELKGKDLAYWCLEDDPCHGDVLLELANE